VSGIPSDSVAILVELVDRVESGTLRRLKRVTPEALSWQPDPEANSIGVTIWHYSRWFDLLGTVTLPGGPNEAQRWMRDGWTARTGYDPSGIGFGGLGLITGYTVAEMRTVPQLEAEKLGEYHRSAMASLRAALAREDARTLAQTVHFVDSDPTRFELVFGTLLGATRHLGEIDALLSLYSRLKA
jgi:DinB family protein